MAVTMSPKVLFPGNLPTLFVQTTSLSTFHTLQEPWLPDRCRLCGTTRASQGSHLPIAGGASLWTAVPLNSPLNTDSLNRTSRRQDKKNNEVSEVVCMAHPRRVQMVSQQIRRELSEMLLHDKVLQEAVIPEKSVGSDLYLSCVASISDVEMSGDLQVAKVYVSVVGDDQGKQVALAGLKAKQGYVRSGLGKRMRLRVIPEVRFIHDDALERGSKVLAMLGKLKDEREKREAGEVVLHNVDVDDDELDEPLTKGRRGGRKAKNEKNAVIKPKVAPKFVMKKEESEDSDQDGDGPEYGEGENIIFIN